MRWMTRTNHRSAPVYRRHFGLENRHGLCRCQAWNGMQKPSRRRLDRERPNVRLNFALMLSPPLRLKLRRMDGLRSMCTRTSMLCKGGLATCTRRDMHGLQNKPRKTTMSDDTWLLVCTKRTWRQNVAECQTLQKRTLLRAILATWKHACLRQEDVINQSPKCFHGV